MMKAGQQRQRHQWLIFCVAAIILDFVPFVRRPFLWIETFFHEISHGLMAITSGGEIVSLTLHYDGSGLCTSQGGVSVLISFFGYFGSAAWGLLIYLLADNTKPRSAHAFIGLLIILLFLVLVLWAENISTYVILTIMITLFSAGFRYANSKTLKLLLQLIGIFVLLDAIRSPLALIDGRDHGDGARLADLTMVPELVWIALWMLSGLSMLFLIYRLSSDR
jgi:hypothetical protein